MYFFSNVSCLRSRTLCRFVLSLLHTALVVLTIYSAKAIIVPHLIM